MAREDSSATVFAVTGIRQVTNGRRSQSDIETIRDPSADGKTVLQERLNAALQK